MRGLVGLGILFVIAGSSAAGSREPAGGRALDPLVACRAIVDSTERLACYDRTVQALQGAADRRDIVVVDRADVSRARRSLFGFTLPSLEIFGSGDKAGAEQNEVREITGTIRASRQDGEGNWIVILDDGATWHQTDGQVIARAPRSGDVVVIRRAALGSYFLRVGRQPGVKARREG